MSKKNKKPRENQKKSNIPGLLQKQKSKKPRENQKKQKNQKKPIFQDSCKSKNAKIQKTSRKPKKTKKQYSRSLEIGSTGKSPGTLFFLFFLVFWIFAFLLLQESWNIVFF